MSNYISRISSASALAMALLLSWPLPVQGRNGFSPMEDPALKNSYQSARDLQTIFRAVYDYARPGVVQITTEVENPQQRPNSSNPMPPQSQGSGFIIDSNGWIVTNRHVIGDASEVTVKLHDGRTFTAKVRGSDPLTDIALIRVQGAGSLDSLKLGDSDRVRVGDWAIALGNPFGLDGSFTIGVISAVGRVGLDASGLNFIQTDASINQGNSGGPLLNLEGEVIGINRMILSPSGGSVGIGFAIPTNEVRYVIEEIRRNGHVDRGLLGVAVDVLPAKMRKFTNGRGVLVTGVKPGTGADLAGIKKGDIILRVDGKTVLYPGELVGLISRRKPGDKVEVEIIRNYKTLEFSVTLGRR
ncbi:MAG: trypsin-like peptidase domain-containing protein [Leptospiraceae bacterium]|nr:trypsin-like peptidase domain-containing protein [Leptospiraceae bacterium]